MFLNSCGGITSITSTGGSVVMSRIFNRECEKYSAFPAYTKISKLGEVLVFKLTWAVTSAFEVKLVSPVSI